MKKLYYLIVLSFLISCQSGNKDAQNTESEKNPNGEKIDFKSCYEKLKTTKEKGTYIMLSEQFEKSINPDTKTWIPKYYASYSLILASLLEEDKELKDKLLDKAQLLLDDCSKIDPNEPEFHILQSFLYISAIQVDVAMRGMALREKIMESFDKAMKLDANNPRLHLLMGTATFYKPEEYGGGAKNALPTFKLAETNYKSFKSNILYYPDWGEDILMEYIKECNEKLK